MIKIGIIGIGKWGQNHLKSLTHLPCTLCGIADTDPTRKTLADQYHTPFYQNYHDLLPHVDAVTITTPTDTHFQVVMDCLTAGKHVLVEKPIATTSQESKQLVTYAQHHNLILSVGYLYRFNNAIIKTKELLPHIGKIQYITSRYIHSTKPPRQDSGAILNLGIHPIDILTYITGKKPTRVYAKKQNLLSPRYEDSAMMLFDYQTFFATIEVSCTHPEKKRDLWIIAEKEKLYIDYFTQKIIRYPLQVTYQNVTREDSHEEPLTPNEPLKDELHYFIDLVDKQDQQKILDTENIGKEEYYTTRACELSIRSAETGKEMQIP
jgi:predicted dehydrogenase